MGDQSTKHAGVYWRAGKVFVHSNHKMITGAFLAQDDPIALDEANFEGIGAALNAKLASYRDDAPVPRWDLVKGNRFPNLHAAAGVQSTGEFMKGAKWISAQLENERVELVPWRNEGARDGFAPLKGRDRTIAEDAPVAELGAAVIAALADAE